MPTEKPEHSSIVKPYRGGADKPFIAACTCGWEDVQGSHSASQAASAWSDHAAMAVNFGVDWRNPQTLQSPQG